MNRYLIVQEPTCTWAVFATLSDVPADLEGQVAMGWTNARRANAGIIATDSTTDLAIVRGLASTPHRLRCGVGGGGVVAVGISAVPA